MMKPVDEEEYHTIVETVKPITLGSSSIEEMRSERRSKHRRGSGDCCAEEATIDSSCATSTPNRERGTFSLTYFFIIFVRLEEIHFQTSPLNTVSSSIELHMHRQIYGVFNVCFCRRDVGVKMCSID